MWYISDTAKIPQGVINMDFFYVHLNAGSSETFQLKLEGQDRKFDFSLDTKDECMKWLQCLDKHIKASDGFKEKKSGKGIKKPWRFDCCSEDQFTSEADTGDIILFRSN